MKFNFWMWEVDIQLPEVGSWMLALEVELPEIGSETWAVGT